jgi:hypothetical protein
MRSTIVCTLLVLGLGCSRAPDPQPQLTSLEQAAGDLGARQHALELDLASRPSSEEIESLVHWLEALEARQVALEEENLGLRRSLSEARLGALLGSCVGACGACDPCGCPSPFEPSPYHLQGADGAAAL